MSSDSSTEQNVSEAIIDNIILEESSIQNSSNLSTVLTLFSSLKADAKPVKDFKLNTSGIEYPQMYSAKCAICNSPHRTLLEHVYIDSGKKINAVVTFFEEHFNAKLNWPQVKQHIKFHCDMNKIETPGLLQYDGENEDLSKWKYRELELALAITLKEINDLGGVVTKTLDEQNKKTMLMDKLSSKLMQIKQARDSLGLNLPNVFEVLYQVHELMVDDEDKRIIREKMRELKQLIE